MRSRFRRQMRRALRQEVPPILQEADFAFSKGEYGSAAELFEKIARTADERGGPRAPLFHLHAGRARVLATQIDFGMPSIKRGLELFSQRGQLPQLHRTGGRVVQELNELGFNDEAAEIEAWLKTFLTDMPAFEPPTKRPALPTHCPACGAPLRPDEVEWLDEGTAECGYCGSPTRSG